MARPQRIPESLLESAAERLVTVPAHERRSAARLLIRNAPVHNIDLSLLWGVVGEDPGVVAQTCLLVPAAGRTGMLYLSAPNEVFPQSKQQHQARVELLRAVFAEVDASMPNRIRLLQTLTGAGEEWADQACLEAGMTTIGTLAYLKRSISRRESAPSVLPSDVRLCPVGDMNADPDRRVLGIALERSYIETKDCPGLCDLRAIDDVIDSHQATGEYNPALWWVVQAEGEPHGALLLARYPDQSVMELVYLGLSPTLRKRGIGRALMEHAIETTRRVGVAEMTCAVDTHNGDAMRLYERLGFRQFDVRRALVRPTHHA